MFAIGLGLLAAPIARVSAAQTASVSKKRVEVNAADAALTKLLADAQAAADRKDYETAAKDYESYLSKQPNDANAHFQLGYTYTALQRANDAKVEYEKAISYRSQDGAAYLNLGLTLLETDPNEAVGVLQKAADLAPNDARPKFLLGLAFERSGKLPEPSPNISRPKIWPTRILTSASARAAYF